MEGKAKFQKNVSCLHILKIKVHEGGEVPMRISVSQHILDEAIKNLLSAQKRIADSGSAKDVIKITNFLLHLSEKFCDVLVDVDSKCQE